MADKTVASLTSSTPTIDDLTISYDNADTSELKKTTWQLVRDLFKTYFDTIYQAVLVSWTNIKTVNGNTLLGSGDIVISGWSGTLAWLTDVDIATPANWEIISYNSTSSKWENVPLSGGGDMLASTYDPAGIAQQMAGLTATQTFSIGVKTFLAGMFGLRNVANTFTSFFTNTNTASRTYTLKDANWTIAFTSDITGTNSGTNTGDETTWRINTLYGTTNAITVGSVEVWHATDTTISRVSAGKIAVEGVNLLTTSSTETVTNKRVTKRVETVASSATPASNTDSYDITKITGLATAITSLTSGLTGTPVDGDMHLWSFTDNWTARAITPGASFENSTVSFPWTTVISTRLDVLCEWNTATSKWRVIATS